MNKSVKKILFIFIPALILMLVIGISFYFESSSKSRIYNSTIDSEYVTYQMDEFSSVAFTSSDDNSTKYQTKATFVLKNMANYSLDEFTVKITFVDESGLEWVEEQNNITFTNKNINIFVEKISDDKIVRLSSVSIRFDEIYSTIYTMDEYKELYGENNQIVSEQAVKVYSILALIFIIFSIFTVVAGVALILVYMDTDKKKPIKNINHTKEKTPKE